MKKAGLPEPRFRQLEVSSHQVHVTLENDIQHRKSFIDSEAFKYVSESIFNELFNEEKLIVNYLAEQGEINITCAATLIGKSWPTANKIMRALVERWVIKLRTRRGRKHDSTKIYELRRE